MHAPPCFVNERAFIVDSEDFGARFIALQLVRDESSNPFDAAARIVCTGGNRRGQERGGSVLRQSSRYSGHCLVGSLHDVVAACAMDMHVDEARYCGLSAGHNFLSAIRHAHSLARANGFDDSVADQYPYI